MISYAPFYRTLLEKGVTEYHLIYKQGFSANILHRMKHGKTNHTENAGYTVLYPKLQCFGHYRVYPG